MNAPGRIVNFAVNMRSVALHGADLTAAEGGEVPELSVRIALMKPSAVAMLGLPPKTTHVWSVVRARPGAPDAFVIGGPAESMTEAAARGEVALQKIQAEAAEKDRH